MARLDGRGVPLRVGLVAATLVLVACGLLASGIAVTSILQHSLINRVDQTLLDASRGWAQAPRRVPRIPRSKGRTPPGRPRTSTSVALDPDGRTWMAVNDREAEPALPDSNDVGPVPVTVGSIDHSNVRWRAMTVRGLRGELTTVAIDLSDVTSTVRALMWSQVGIGVVCLLGHRHRGLRGGASKPAATRRSRADRGGHRQRRARTTDTRARHAHRGRAAFAGAQRNARADPAGGGVIRGLCRARTHLRGPHATVHHRCQPRAPYAAHHHPWLRRPVPSGRCPRRRIADEPDRE